jgi:hypothetical protein
MMTTAYVKAHRPPFLVYVVGVFISLLLISAETVTPSIACAGPNSDCSTSVSSVASCSSPWHSSQRTQ